MSVVEPTLAWGFFFGVVFGIIVQRMSFCISTDLAQAFVGNYRRMLLWFAIIFIITGAGFQYLGPKAVGQLRGYGVYNILSGIFFGLGIILSGGCVIGTLRRMGEGFLHSWIVFFSWIPGMALVVYVLNPILQSTYHIQKPLLSDVLGVNHWYVYGALAVIFGALAIWASRKE